MSAAASRPLRARHMAQPTAAAAGPRRPAPGPRRRAPGPEERRRRLPSSPTAEHRAVVRPSSFAGRRRPPRPRPAARPRHRRPASPRLGSGRAPPSSSSSSHAGLLPRQVRRAATVTPACIGKRADLDPDLRNSSRLTFRP